MSEESITRQQAGRFRRAKNEPSARRSLAGGCCGHKFLESRDEEELGYASLESKSEILGKGDDPPAAPTGPERDPTITVEALCRSPTKQEFLQLVAREKTLVLMRRKIPPTNCWCG